MASGGDRTEKATPKKRDDARKKGQVARSMDLNGAVVLLAALFALSAFAPRMLQRIGDASRELLLLCSQPDVVGREGIGDVLMEVANAWLLSLAPVAAVCLVAGLLTSVGQVGFKPSFEAVKPDPKKLNPLAGAKMIFGTHALFEGAKSIVKVVAVGSIAALALLPKLDELAALVGMPPAVLLPEIGHMALGIAQRAAVRLPHHRRRRRDLPALAPREAAARWTSRRSRTRASSSSCRPRSRARSAAGRWSSPARA